MFGIGSAELLVIFIIVLIVLGPDKLPGIFRAVGKGISQFRNTLNETDQKEDSEHKNDSKEDKKGVS